jgi:hypothetical protein
MSHTPIHELERKLRTVHYVRYGGPRDEPQTFENSLLAFIYDIPDFGACGVFPPLHLLNHFLNQGDSEGGMSPGASWKPFELSLTEFHDLVQAVKTVPVESLRSRARYAHVQFTFDPEFDGPPESWPARSPAERWFATLPPDLRAYVAWMNAVCDKHRARWHAELKRAGFMTDRRRTAGVPALRVWSTETRTRKARWQTPAPCRN